MQSEGPIYVDIGSLGLLKRNMPIASALTPDRFMENDNHGGVESCSGRAPKVTVCKVYSRRINAVTR